MNELLRAAGYFSTTKKINACCTSIVKMLYRLFPEPGIKPDEGKQTHQNPYVKNYIAQVDLVFEECVAVPDPYRDIDRHPQHQERNCCNKPPEKFFNARFHQIPY